MTKTKEQALEEAYNDILYSTKTIGEVLNTLYETAFGNGFLQGNDNAKEMAEYQEKR